MSRIGKMPVTLPKGVKAEIAGQLLKVEGPKGKLERQLRPEITAQLVDGDLLFTRIDDSKEARAYHGLERSLANNMVQGVFEGYEKQLALQGVGYRAEMKGNSFELALGYSHPINFPLPDGVQGSILKEGRDLYLKIEGVDKQQVGEVAASIRSLRPPEPYKGKGVRYRNEIVRRKAGKAGK